MSFVDSITALVGNAAAKLLPAWAQPFRKPGVSPACADEDDPRKAALEALRDYLAAVDLRFPNGRTGHIHKDDIFTTASGDAGGESDLHLPSLGVAGGQGDDELPGLGPPEIDDDTWGIRGPGTALVWVGEHRERCTLELWASDDEERDAILRELRGAFRPADGMGTLVLPLPKYFDQLARFSLAGLQVLDDQDAARNRRRVLCTVELEVAVMKLIGVVELQPKIRVEITTAEDDC